MSSTYLNSALPSFSQTQRTSETSPSPAQLAETTSTTSSGCGGQDSMDAGSSLGSLLGSLLGAPSTQGLGLDQQPGLSGDMRALETLVQLVSVVAEALEQGGATDTTDSDMQPTTPLDSSPVATTQLASPSPTTSTIPAATDSGGLPLNLPSQYDAPTTSAVPTATDSGGLPLNLPGQYDANAGLEAAPPSALPSTPADAAHGDDLPIYLPK